MDDNLIDVNALKPFPKFMYTIGMIPTSFKVSLTYEEQVLEIMHFIKDEMIPKINANALATKELQEKFVELKNYVDEYFTDLNVQEQINNKLDDMAESGELAEIINEEIFGELNTQVQTNTQDITDLKNRKIYNFLASDYDTLQEAIDAADTAGESLYLDEGLTIDATGTTINAKCSIIGLGDNEILCSYIDILKPNVTIANVKITATSDRIININAGDSSVIKDNIKIENCKLILDNAVTLLPYAIIYATQTISIDNLQILNNEIENAGIQLGCCTNFKIEGNIIDGLMNVNSQNELIHTSYNSSGIIHNNILRNNVYDFIDIYSAGDRTIITNNKMYNGKMNGIEAKVVLADDGGSGDTNGYVANCIISDNIIENLNATDNGEYAGILAVMYDRRTDTSVAPTENQVPKNLIITNNIIRDINVAVGGRYCGIKTSANNSIIANNLIQNVHNGDTQTAGIYYYTEYSTPQNFQIENNRLKGCYPAGIQIQNGRDGIISGNTFERDSEGTNNNYGNRYGIGIAEGYGLVITNNLFKSTASYGIEQTDGSNILSNLLISNNNFSESSLHLTNVIMSVIENNIFNKSHTLGQPALKIDSVTARRLINILGNSFYNLGTGMAININNMEYVNINNNIFSVCSYPIYLQNACKKYNIVNNISYNTTNPDFVIFSNVSVEDQATINRDANIDDKD